MIYEIIISATLKTFLKSFAYGPDKRSVSLSRDDAEWYNQLRKANDCGAFDKQVYLENINLILAFIINIISQPIEHLNISSASIVRLIRKCTWYFLTQ